MRDRVAAVLAGVLHRELGDQRPPERGEQRIAKAVDGVGLDRRRHVLMRELLPRINDEGFNCAQLPGLALDDLIILTGLPKVDGQRHHLGPIFVLNPLEHHTRVQAAAVEQQHAMDVRRVCQIRSRPDLRVFDAHSPQGYGTALSGVR